MLKWTWLLLAAIYFWLYPAILLVPTEYRTSYWSVDQNIERRGIVDGRQICDIWSTFQNTRIYRVSVQTNGKLEHFWVANEYLFKRMASGELVSFETRGNVIVLAHPVESRSVVISLLD